MTPEVLFRITTPDVIKIKNGYFQPHDESSEYGNSVPLIARRDLLSIANWFGGEYVLKPKGLDFFVLLAFKSNRLKNIIDSQVISRNAYQEYWAEAPVDALISAMKFVWLPTRDYNLDPYKPSTFGKSTKYIGKFEIKTSSLKL